MTLGVAIPSIPPRKALLVEAWKSAVNQTQMPDEIAIAIDHEGKGAAATRNEATAMLKTDWVAYLDDDDVFYPDHLESLVRCQEETGADLVYPWFRVVGGEDPLGRFGQEFDPDYLLNVGNYVPVTYLARRELVLSVGGFPELNSERWQFGNCEDWCLLQDIVRAGAKVVHLPKVTWEWRHRVGEGFPNGNTSGKPWREALAVQ